MVALQRWTGVATDLLACPSCPTAKAAREIFFTEDVFTRMSGMVTPFLVMLGVVGLVLVKLSDRSRRPGARGGHAPPDAGAQKEQAEGDHGAR
jgi:hypothetical protein